MSTSSPQQSRPQSTCSVAMASPSTTSTASFSSSSLSLVASARSADSQSQPITRSTSVFSATSNSFSDCSALTQVRSPSLSPDLTHHVKQLAALQTTLETRPSVVVPKSNQQQQPKYQDQSKMDYLEFLYPNPQRPPRYSSVKSSRGINFPIYERPETSILPSYSPAVSEITLVLRKVEWLSPYEPSTVRGWKNLIMQLNSTQLNFYTVEGIPILSKVKKSKTKKHYEFTPIEQDFILESIKRNPQKYLSPSKLVKSYSLQHAKFGLPIDYKKRQSCLRLRCETEQFIVQYIDLDNLIQWANALSIGINVSLDLDSREMPTDRIVPRRRRRNRRNRNRAFSDSELIRRELAEPRHPRRASFSGESTGLKSKISRIFGRKRSNTVDMEQLTRDFGELDTQLPVVSVSTSHSATITSSATTTINTTKSTDDNQISPRHQRNTSTSSNNALFGTIREEDERGSEHEDDEDQEEDDDEEDDEIDEDEEEEDEDEDDSHHHELHHSNCPLLHDSQDSHDSEDEESIHNGFKNFSMSSGTRKAAQHSLDEKWHPDPKKYSRRKFLKDSLRCIKLLSNEDTWVGKRVVKSSRVLSRSGKGNTRYIWEECTVGLQGLVPSAFLDQRAQQIV